MASIFDEKFEDSTGDGYDETGWTEVVGTGCTIDSDADVADVSSPANWGSECLKIIHKATKANFAYNVIGDVSIAYTRIEVVLTDLSNVATNGDCFYICGATDGAEDVCWYIRVEADASDDARFFLYMLWDGVHTGTFIGDDIIIEDTLYRIEIKWDGTNDRIGWKINGVLQDEEDLVAGHKDQGNLLTGWFLTTNVVDGEFYADLVAIDNADWVGTSIFDEQFEGTGYERSDWTEVVGTGATIDEDANVTDVDSPVNWGSQCLKLVGKAGDQNYAYNQFGDAAIRYVSFEFCFTDLSSLTSLNNIAYIAFALNNAINTYCWYVRVEYNSNGDIQFRIAVYVNGSNSETLDSVKIEEDVVYRVDIKWDSTNDVAQVALDGVLLYKDLALTAGHVEMGTIVLGNAFISNTVDNTLYIDRVMIDDADWVTTPHRVFDERFEITNYERYIWNESVGAGSTIDEDAAVSGAGSPTNWGSKCCKIIVNDNTTYTYNATIGAEPILYWRVEFVVTAEGLANNRVEYLFNFYNDAISAPAFIFFLGKTAGGVLEFVGACYDDGSVNYYTSFVTPVIDTKYRFELKWDATNDDWAWRIDGVNQPNDQDSSDPVTSEGLLTSTHSTDAGVVLLGTLCYNNEGYTCYYDLIAASTTDWVGAEGWGGKVLGVSNPAKVMGVEISKIIGV